jgi:hypothetical protein
MTSPIVKWTSPFSSGNEPITKEQYDDYMIGYLRYADELWATVLAGEPPTRKEEIIFQAALSPFEYWLRDTIKSERKAKENMSLPKK